MRHLKSYKLFEGEGGSYTLPTTSKEDLTNYYTCYKCNALFKTFNKEADICPHCGQGEATPVSDFEYMAIAKHNLSPEDYQKELNLKKKRETEYVDLVGMGLDNEIKKARSRYN